MSRSLTQIYAEAVTSRNNFMQLTNMQPSDVNKSKLSIMNLMTYVMAVLIYSYETILDVFQIDIALFIESRINGTPKWYAYMATLFQFDVKTQTQDKMDFNQQTFKPEYITTNKDHRIVKKSSCSTTDDKYDLVLKICKSATADVDSPYMELTNTELNAFKAYMESIKFIGVKIKYISMPGDLLHVSATVYYDKAYSNKDNVFASIKNNLLNYSNMLDYDSYIYFQDIMNCIVKADGVISVESGVELTMQSHNGKEYDVAKKITNRTLPLSGYVTFFNQDNKTTITPDNIIILPIE